MTFVAPKNSLVAFVLVASILSSNINVGQATIPKWPSACPSGVPYSDTEDDQNRCMCKAPEVICCPSSGQCPSSTTAATSTTSTSTAATTTSSPSSTSTASTDFFSTDITANYSTVESTTGASSTSVSSSTTMSTTTAIGSNEPCPCQLIIAFLKFMYAYLDAVEQAIFESECLVPLRAILMDVTLTYEEKVVKCGRVIRKFCSKRQSIGDKLKWVKIGDFGHCHNFAYVVAKAYEDEMAKKITDRIDDSGACNLTVAISNATSQNQCGPGSAAVWGEIVSKFHKLNKRTIPGMSRGRKWGYFFKKLVHIFFKKYPAHEQCIRDIKIDTDEYKGTVGEFLDLCSWYDIQTSILTSLLVDNSTTGKSPFISSCEEGVSSANSSGQYNQSVVQEADEYVKKCKLQFASNSDANSRLTYILNLFISLSSECRLLLKGILISGGNAPCLFADMISNGHSCKNGYACQNITYGGPAESFNETCMVDSFNISSLVLGSDDFMNSGLLTPAEKSSYKMYCHNAIVNCIYSTNSLLLRGHEKTLEGRTLCAKEILSNYATNNAKLRGLLMAYELSTTLIVKVVNNVISVVFGTFGCFCGCTSC